jgi:hypothetical protein
MDNIDIMGLPEGEEREALFETNDWEFHMN